MFSPKRIVAIFRQRGGLGEYTKTGDRLTAAQTALLGIELGEDAPIIASIRSGEHWFAFTSSRLILKDGRAVRSIPLEDILGLARPFTAEHWAQGKISGGKIEVQLKDGSVLPLDVESPKPFFGLANVFRYLSKVNNKK